MRRNVATPPCSNSRPSCARTPRRCAHSRRRRKVEDERAAERRRGGARRVGGRRLVPHQVEVEHLGYHQLALKLARLARARPHAAPRRLAADRGAPATPTPCRGATAPNRPSSDSRENWRRRAAPPPPSAPRGAGLRAARAAAATAARRRRRHRRGRRPGWSRRRDRRARSSPRASSHARVRGSGARRRRRWPSSVRCAPGTQVTGRERNCSSAGAAFPLAQFEVRLLTLERSAHGVTWWKLGCSCRSWFARRHTPRRRAARASAPGTDGRALVVARRQRKRAEPTTRPGDAVGSSSIDAARRRAGAQVVALQLARRVGRRRYRRRRRSPPPRRRHRRCFMELCCGGIAVSALLLTRGLLASAICAPSARSSTHNGGARRRRGCAAAATAFGSARLQPCDSDVLSACARSSTSCPRSAAATLHRRRRKTVTPRLSQSPRTPPSFLCAPNRSVLRTIC